MELTQKELAEVQGRLTPSEYILTVARSETGRALVVIGGGDFDYRAELKSEKAAAK